LNICRQKSRSQTPWKFLLGILCLALLVFGSVVQVAHTHPGGDIAHTDCSLCATAHIVAQLVSQPVPVPATFIFSAVREFTAAPRPQKLSVFALFTRPPPRVSIPA
jgi:hypothetical protein